MKGKFSNRLIYFLATHFEPCDHFLRLDMQKCISPIEKDQYSFALLRSRFHSHKCMVTA